MSAPARSKRIPLRTDEPTAPTPPAAPQPIPQAVPQPVAQAVVAAPPAWREWKPATGATSYRLPPELLTELGARARALGVPQGQLVLAAITALLDERDERIVELCDRAAWALHAGRPATRKPTR
ncbi:MAG: hypothetical protein ACLP0J_15150 [Solirubrobacteraceae bacterium]